MNELGVLARRADDQTGFGPAVEHELLIRMRLIRPTSYDQRRRPMNRLSNKWVLTSLSPGCPARHANRGPPFRQAVRLVERAPARSGRRAAYALRLIVSCDEIDSHLKRRRRSSCRGMSRRAASSGGQRAICPRLTQPSGRGDHPRRIQNLGLLMYGRMDVAGAADQPISAGESRKEQRAVGCGGPRRDHRPGGWSS